jgi:hypothetical protein
MEIVKQNIILDRIIVLFRCVETTGAGRYRAAFFGIVMDCVVLEQQSTADWSVVFWHRAVVVLYRYNARYGLR